MVKIENIAKNTSYLTLALIIQKVISFSYFTLLARYVGPTNLGKYYLAISFTTIFAIFIDLGFANILTREVAKDKDRAESWLANILGLKILLTGVALLAVGLVANLLGYELLTKQLIYISTISMVLDSFTATFFAVARGCHNLKYESWSSIIFQLIVLTVGYSALLVGQGLTAAMFALALASTYNFLYSAFILKWRLKIKLRLAWQPELLRTIILFSWPFAAYAILQRLYTYLDSVLLSVFAGETQVGLYQIAFKIIFALQFLPMAFTASLYPALSAYWQGNREQLIISFERALSYLIIISVPIIAGALALSDQIIFLFKSGYEDAALPLRIGIIALFFIFINFPIGSLLNAADAQKTNTRNMLIVMLVSILLNLLLIPRYQAVGASLTVLITNALMTILGLLSVRRLIKHNYRKNLIILAKSLLAALVMSLIIFQGKLFINIFLLVMAGGSLYFCLLFLLGAFSRADLISISRSFWRPKNIDL